MRPSASSSTRRRAQAEAGFAREEEAGLARDHPRRTYRDPRAKPEVLVALEPTWVMAGFRTGDDAAAALAPWAAAHPAVAALRDRVADEPDARAAPGAPARPHPTRSGRALAAAAAATDPAAGERHRWVAALAAALPG